MWVAVLPQIPEHLLLGKGWAISATDFQMMGVDTAFGRQNIDPSQQGLALSGDYHNGPLSVIIPFGIWGIITFFWFAFAGLFVVYRNFRHGDPAYKVINTFLFVNYLVMLLMFIFVGGGMSSDVARFVAPLGLSIAINGGLCRVPQKVPAEAAQRRPNPMLRPRPSFPR
jgi:hypothetical protein